MKISADHPDAGKPLLHAAARALATLGARVEIAIGGENLVRRTPVDEHGHTAVVMAEGLPNLLHELVHAVQAGVVDDDWGIDYGAIPFDLDTLAGRRVLWEELACSVLSCAYVQAPEPAETAARANARVVAWFREQVEIQPVFYGMEGDTPAFWSRVHALAGLCRDEVEAVIDTAYAATAAALQAAGAPPRCIRPPRRLTLWEMLDRAQAGGRLVDA